MWEVFSNVFGGLWEVVLRCVRGVGEKCFWEVVGKEPTLQTYDVKTDQATIFLCKRGIVESKSRLAVERESTR